ncbi:MAG: tellurite resistance TerB family protein [Deltaproteobacteria bacterium]|nr:tellurite resistance TerB family protein [Deltaproteobacteria bacterium]
MDIGLLLEAMMKSGISPSSENRMRNATGLDGLSEIFGGDSPPSGGGDLTDLLSAMLGGQERQPPGGGVLGDVLGQVGHAVGGRNNLAVGGLGALLGALFGGGGKSMGGALGGGLMALLGAMAFKALKNSGQNAQPPLGLVEPKTDRESCQLEHQSELVLRAMINAAKADNRIDEHEIRRMGGKLQEFGADAEAQRYMMKQMQKPMETDDLIAAAQGQPELAAEIYAASLLTIEVDTPAERNYLNRLASGLGLNPQVTKSIEDLIGLNP